MPEAGAHQQAVECQASSDMSLKHTFTDKQLIVRQSLLGRPEQVFMVKQLNTVPGLHVSLGA